VIKMALVTIDGIPLSEVEKEKLWGIIFDYVGDYIDKDGFGLNPPYLFIGSYVELLGHLRDLHIKDKRLKAIEVIEV
jgi:hypothetical protein